MSRSRPNAAGADARAAVPEIHAQETLRALHSDALTLHQGLDLLVELLGQCAPAHQVSAGAVLALLDPVAGGLEALQADLYTLAAARSIAQHGPPPLRGAAQFRAAGA